jgi:hypothetical protein
MLTSGLQNTTILYAQLSVTATSITTSRVRNSLEGDLSGLVSAIKSGDTVEARSCLAELHMISATNVDPASPIGIFLANVTNSLTSFDIAGAQSALGALEATAAAPRVEPAASSNALSLVPSQRLGPAISPVGKDLMTLFSAVSSGDTEGAQTAYGALSNLLDSGTANSSQYGNLLESGAESGSLYSLMTQIGTALSTGNLSRVQGTMDQFMQNLSSGSLVSASA